MSQVPYTIIIRAFFMELKYEKAQNDSLNSQRTGQNGIIFKETMKAILILFKYLLYRQSLNPLMLKFLYGRDNLVN
jgi:hypothetical protein